MINRIISFQFHIIKVKVTCIANLIILKTLRQQLNLGFLIEVGGFFTVYFKKIKIILYLFTGHVSLYQWPNKSSFILDQAGQLMAADVLGAFP